MRRAVTLGAVLACVALAGWLLTGAAQRSDPAGGVSVPNVVTADIQAGIEKHVEEQTRIGGGYFRFSSGDRELALKLVRVHTEYLSNLGPRRHFACVDLVDTKGDVYDVDFFLSGDPGAMTVTETTLNKLNGRPFYAWKQTRDGTWGRVPVKDASNDLLGVIEGRDSFEFLYRARLPKIDDMARMWIPLAATDAFQTVAVKSIIAPGKQRVLEDQEYGNKVLFLELGPADGGKTVEISYDVNRIEKAAYEDPASDPARYLNPERLVPDDETFRTIAEQIVEGKKGDLVRARALYDHVIDRMRYMKYGTGWGRGDAVYACNARTGNCTDFHAYFIALARAVGIPARFAIGAAIPSERNDGGIDGYHCWIEFHAEGKWWPVDISEASKYSAISTYYFGHHPANRFELSRGRDLVLDPGPASGPINFLAYPVLEMDGKTANTNVEFSFHRSLPAE
jgi:transglutaminase-like putative cysteine protease